MAKKNILICGATGFIGRNTAEHFAKDSGYNVFGTYWKSRSIKHGRIQMIRADLTNKEDVGNVIRGKDIVIQLAAITSGAKDILAKPYIHVTDNAIMNSLIFRAAYKNNVSHVLFPSCAVMYSSSNIPLKEADFDANREMHSKYFGAGWTKVYLEKMCEFYSRLGNTRYTVMRHSNTYGPYDKFDLERSHVFGATMAKVMSAKEGESITVWGTGEEERDLLYVSDLISFIENAIERQKTQFELVNVGYGSSISVNDLVKKIIMASGKNLGINYDSEKPTIKIKLALDSAKALKVFGWRPKVLLDEGIKKTISWYMENILFK